MGDYIEGSTETVTIKTSRYESLLADSKQLQGLKERGVDNWEGYSAPMDEDEEDDDE